MKKAKTYQNLFGVTMILISMVSQIQIGSVAMGVKETRAAGNLITNPSFEDNIDANWSVWKSNSSTRTYEFYRAYEGAAGYGQYSAAISASGNPEGRFDAGMVTKDANKFQVESGKKYAFSFYAKSSVPTKVSVYLEKSTTFESITDITERSITTEWQKFFVNFSPNSSGPALLSIVFGDMPNSAELDLDGFNLDVVNNAMTTKEVRGYVGDKNKRIAISNIGNYSLNDIEIELPYYDADKDEPTVKRFSPVKIDPSGVNFDMPVGTFSGYGKAYLFDGLIGQFDYIVLPKITDFDPDLVRVDEDLTVYGTGVNPYNTMVVVNITDSKGKIFDKWIKPHTFDPNLELVALKLPVGLANGKVTLKTSYRNAAGQDITISSNSLNYKIKPVIYKMEWSRKGYEQVGDKIKIHGKGISSHPQVVFYDDAGKKVATYNAAVLSIDEATNEEIIEVATPKNVNKLKVTVKIGSTESDISQALGYTAKTRLISITSSKYRTVLSNGSKVPAARTGEKIRLSGSGFKSDNTISVNFTTLHGKIAVKVDSKNIDKNGNWINVVVPVTAQNGYVYVQANGQTSNSLTLEIIPTITATFPSEPNPGYEMSISTTGVGLDVKQATIYFHLAGSEVVTAKPNSITENGESTIIKVDVPRSISSKYSSLTVKYGNWSSEGTFGLTARPTINYASIDADSKVLTIRGYGFSIKPAENKIIYKYSDHTVVNPKTSMIGVYNTSEGQEIRVSILDNYQYGFVSVVVNGTESNEATVGPAKIQKIERRVQFVKSENQVMGVLYISGYNFGAEGDVKVGDAWATTHYRTNYFIIAVVPKEDINKNPVIVTKR
jgi:hypothetical protein